MNQGMTKRGLAVALCVAVWSAACIAGDKEPTIRVNGEALVNVQPDKIVVSLGIQTWDAAVAEAKAKNTAILKEALHRIDDQGVPDKDIQTDHLSVSPSYQDHTRSRIIDGYFVRNKFTVTLSDASMVESLVTAMLEAGVTDIFGITFETTEYKKHREQARVMALEAAREKAEKMATVLGQRVGRPISINENGYGYSGRSGSSWSGYGWRSSRYSGMYHQNVMQNVGGNDGGIAGSVALGKIGIRAQVSVVFALVEKK